MPTGKTQRGWIVSAAMLGAKTTKLKMVNPDGGVETFTVLKRPLMAFDRPGVQGAASSED